MNNELDLATIYKYATKLTQEEQLELISKLAISLLRSNNKKHKLKELRGLGKELWQKVNSTEYLENLRKEWNVRQI